MSTLEFEQRITDVKRAVIWWRSLGDLKRVLIGELFQLPTKVTAGQLVHLYYQLNSDIN